MTTKSPLLQTTYSKESLHQNVVTFNKIQCSITSRPSPFSCNKTTKKILQNISGVAMPGEILAILGPSGSGKTTLLDVIAHRNFSGLSVTGEIYVNGVKGKQEIIHRGAYVSQDDILSTSLTVRETLKYAALLRLPYPLSYTYKMQKVDEVLEMLDLTNIQNSTVGGLLIRGISGGEKRRLSIGIEIITNPSILLADEITSGLDSYAALSVMKVLKKMAERGVTVITTIHQPSSQIYALFDKLLLLSSGRTIYWGDAHYAASYFHRIGYNIPADWNAADYYLDLCSSPQSRDKLIDIFQSQFQHRNKNNDEKTNQYPSSSTPHIADRDHNHSSHPQNNHYSEYLLSDDESLITSSPPNHNTNIGDDDHQQYHEIQNDNHGDDHLHIPPSPSTLQQQLASYHTLTSPSSPSSSQPISPSPHSNKIGSGNGGKSEYEKLYGIGSRKYSTPWHYQMIILIQRNLLRIYKDPIVVGQILISYVFSAILMSMMFADLKSNIENQLTLLLSFMMNLFGINAFFSVAGFISEATIYRREYVSSYYSTSSYFFSKMICFMPINFIICSLYTFIIFYWLELADLDWHKFALLVVLNYLTMEAFLALNEIFGVIFNNLQSGILTAGLANTLIMLFNGVFINYPNIPGYLQWTYWTVFMTYSVSGVMLIQFDSTEAGQQWLAIFGVQVQEISTCIYALLGFFLLFRIAGYLALALSPKSRSSS